MSSAQQYAWLQEHRPEVWERVVKAVGEGTLSIGGVDYTIDKVKRVLSPAGSSAQASQ